ncbi:toxin VasX [Pseudomonas sp. H9]|uniref:toxin VasX n=1 Tax=Pseudomonas sp. H9 TaxID=483968 RepID=UPI002113FB74|nr:toxin VasX [Pseudomonas sp. H9]
MTAQQPPRVSANTAAMAKSNKDVHSPLAACPLMNKRLQLLPLRYGLVEHLDPAAELPLPFKLDSQPLGIRLLRDGYLYIVDGTTGYLHEYHIENGQISKLLWQSNEVTADTRTASVGEPYLLFDRQHTLYACYSEIQWTAFKCAQVLKSKNDRQHFMQRVDLQSACPRFGGANLLSKPQAAKWLAEAAENAQVPDAAGVTQLPPSKAFPDGAHPEEKQPYHWEDQPLFHTTEIEALTSKVLGAYQDDYLFLVLRDDIGVMRDLAAAQLKVADWIEQWSADDTRQTKYLSGSYIHSLYDVNDARLQAVSKTDPDVQALKNDTDEQQQASIYKYLQVRRAHKDPGIFGPDRDWRRAAEVNVYARAFIDMKDALGEPLYDKHRSTLNKLSTQSWQTLHGTEIGQRGIDDLVNRSEMEAFVIAEQNLLSHWHARLQNVRADRLKLFTAGLFHRAAWYYDFTLDAQIKHRLETEFVCVAAMCADQDATEKLATYLENNLLVVVPGLDTLTLADQADIAKKLAELSQFTINMVSAPENLDGINVLTNQFHALMARRLPNYTRLNTQFLGLQSMLEGAYIPAHQLKVADRLERAYDTFKQAQNIDPNGYIRHIGVPARLQLLREFSRRGLTLRAASVGEMTAFNEAREQAMNLRSQLKETYRLRNYELTRQSIGTAMPDSEVPYNQRIKLLKAALAPLEERLAGALTVGGNSPAQIGTVLDGLDAQLRAEMTNTARDFRATRTFNKPMVAVVKSKGDGIALTLFVIQGLKFIEAVNALLKSDRSLAAFGAAGESFIGMSAAGFAAVQGLLVTLFLAHLEQMESAAGKLNTMSRLGKWSGIYGLGAFGFGGIAASIDLGKHSLQWGRALTKGNYKALSASTLQITGDGILVGTNTWAAKHTGSIIKNVLKTPSELRALAWAEASPRLLAISARANLIGLVATALQLLGEGLYNYFNLDDLQEWAEASAWGHKSKQRTLQDEWSELAKVVQKPTCELIRDDKKTYLKLVLPGVSTAEMDQRKLQLQAYEQGRENSIYRHYSPGLPPLRWKESSANWATRFVVVSAGSEALTLHLPIFDFLHTTSFALAFTIAYQLEAEREVFHHTTFVLRNLYITQARGVQIKSKGTYPLKSVEHMPPGTGKAPFWPFKKEDLVAGGA